jgi:hypothetical protein
MEKQLNYVNLVRDRHSTRSYEPHPLTDTDRADIAQAIASAVPLSAAGRLDWRLADKSIMGCSAILYAECGSSTDELIDYGYEGQQIVLALLAREWGTCWYYQFRLPGSPCSITVGRPSTPGLRSAVVGALSRGHTRKTMEQLVPEGMLQDSAAVVRTVLESARLAPSAMNRQPWTFNVTSANEIIVQGNTGRFPDLGICLANAMVSARQLAGTATVSQLDIGKYSVSW